MCPDPSNPWTLQKLLDQTMLPPPAPNCFHTPVIEFPNNAVDGPTRQDSLDHPADDLSLTLPKHFATRLIPIAAPSAMGRAQAFSWLHGAAWMGGWLVGGGIAQPTGAAGVDVTWQTCWVVSS